MRTCDRCNAQMNVGRPRVRVNKQLWCQTCVKDKSAPSGRYKPGTDIKTEAQMTTIGMDSRSVDGSEYALVRLPAVEAMKAGHNLIRQASFVLGLRKTAHDSGDGETIYHCPFCGSGQVLARSDRTIECEFCHTSFTVQVQPEYSAFPQTMDGQPVQVPGMPGQIDEPVGGGPQDPSMAPDPMAAEDMDGDGIPDQGGFDDGAPASADNQPPWLTAGLKTTAGARLPIEEYVHHLAIKHAGPQRTAVLRRVKASREFT